MLHRQCPLATCQFNTGYLNVAGFCDIITDIENCKRYRQYVLGKEE